MNEGFGLNDLNILNIFERQVAPVDCGPSGGGYFSGNCRRVEVFL